MKRVGRRVAVRETKDSEKGDRMANNATVNIGRHDVSCVQEGEGATCLYPRTLIDV